MFRKGQPVKVFAKFGHQTKPEWQRATIAEDVSGRSETVKVSINNGTYDAERRLVKTWHPLPEGDLDEWAKSHYPALLELIRRGVIGLLGDGPGVIKEQPEDYIINVHDFSVAPEVIETESIGGFHQVPSWGVSCWMPTLGDRNNPPDVSEAVCGHGRNDHEAAALLLRSIVEERHRRFWESLNDELFWAQQEKEALANQS